MRKMRGEAILYYVKGFLNMNENVRIITDSGCDISAENEQKYSKYLVIIHMYYIFYLFYHFLLISLQ